MTDGPFQVGMVITDDDDNEVFIHEPDESSLSRDEMSVMLYGFKCALDDLRKRGLSVPKYGFRWLPSESVVTEKQFEVLKWASVEMENKINGVS